MITNPNLIFYACVAKGTTILAEFNSKDADLGTLALKCLQKTPKLHSIFSHTARSKTYMFFITDPFVYFGIFDEKFEKSESLFFLKTIRDSFNEVFEKKRVNDLNDHCFQGEFSPVFRQLISAPSLPDSPKSAGLRSERSLSLDSPVAKKMGSMPLLGDVNMSKGIMKKKNKKKSLFGESNKELLKEKKVDVSDDEDGDMGRDFSVGGGHRNGKRVWKKHVWVVLCLDLIVCVILFGIWLWICKGFKCIDG